MDEDEVTESEGGPHTARSSASSHTPVPKPRKRKPSDASTTPGTATSPPGRGSHRGPPVATPRAKAGRRKRELREAEEEEDHKDNVAVPSLTGLLGGLQEDVTKLRASSEYQAGSNSAASLSPVGGATGTTPSRSRGKVYVEKPRRFVAVDWQDVGACLEEGNGRNGEHAGKGDAVMEVAIALERAWRCCAIWSNGLLAGLGVSHMLMVHLQLSYDGISHLVHFYAPLVPAVWAIFHVLYTLSLVGAFDRADLFSLASDWRGGGRTLPVVTVFMYLVGFGCSMVLYPWEDAIYKEISKELTNDDVLLWLILNGARCLLPVVCWVLVAFDTRNHRFLERLRWLQTRAQT